MALTDANGFSSEAICWIDLNTKFIAWTIVSLVSRVEAILASVCVGGLSGCLLLITPNFISEFSHESIRGTLTSFGIIFYGIGLMVSYILGGCLNYEMMNYVCLTISVLSLIMMSLVEESPVYLMSKDLEKKAAKSIAFYRSSKRGSLIVQQEMESIRRTLNVQMNRKALGTQIQFHWGPAWLKGLFVYAFCITATCGAGTVPYVMIPEMFLPEVRSEG
ncbi:unnamed protein product [Danaus chrysippus]|uniref:(African queen) hypothetical protein n=1 Tax=Danaus chrysippus TaxID=151541 RepID=A0A8J2QY43_9NEOP|nr:unnamed protein product [Danaus chrysippus]